jgi:hypothetical protein
MDTAQTLYQLARAAAPGATVRVSVEVAGGGNTVATTLCKVELTAPDLLNPVCSQGHSPEAATAALRKLYGKGRRQHAIDVLLRECSQRSGYNLDEDTKKRWSYQLAAAQDMNTYERLAATCRTTATQMGLQAAA